MMVGYHSLPMIFIRKILSQENNQSLTYPIHFFKKKTKTDDLFCSKSTSKNVSWLCKKLTRDFLEFEPKRSYADSTLTCSTRPLWIARKSSKINGTLYITQNRFHLVTFLSWFCFPTKILFFVMQIVKWIVGSNLYKYIVFEQWNQSI